MVRIVLASGSPRRRELLEKIGIPFITRVSDVDENMEGYVLAHEYAMAMAYKKAMDIQVEVLKTADAEDIIVAADTVVALDDHILGKPQNREDAQNMLQMLSGKWHEVLTAMVLIRVSDGMLRQSIELTRVKFQKLDAEDIICYLNTGEAFDKAGAYGIQGLGALLVEQIEGDYYNVMGLPLYRLSQMLKDFGVMPYRWLALTALCDER